MDIRFEPATFSDILPALRRHLASLPSAIDSYLEDHIRDAAHYRIVVAGEDAGFAAIHGGSLITSFALAEPYRRHGQPIFARLRRLEEVRASLVPTCDEFFLAHALDDHRHLARQAYFFATPRDLPESDSGQFALRLAEPADAAFIRQESGTFFEHLDRHIAARELFLTLRGDEPVGFGIAVVSALYDSLASIGMFTLERARRAGVGTATIGLLIAECRRRGIRPIAGCWYYNHRSKQTLERAGMYSPTRLLKIDY